MKSKTYCLRMKTFLKDVKKRFEPKPQKCFNHVSETPTFNFGHRFTTRSLRSPFQDICKEIQESLAAFHNAKVVHETVQSGIRKTAFLFKLIEAILGKRTSEVIMRAQTASSCLESLEIDQT